MSKTLGILLLLLAMTAVPVGMIIAGIRHGMGVRDRKTWPSTSGTVLASEVVEQTNRSVILRVRYRYEIDGAAYEGADQVDHPRAEYELSPTLQAGKPIDVLYDNAIPGRSALDAGSHGPTIFFITFGTIGTLIVSPFVAYFGLILFASLMMVKARYHHRKGMKTLGEAVAETNRLYEQEGEMPEVLAERGMEGIAQAAEVDALLGEMESELRGEPEHGESEPAHAAGDAEGLVTEPVPFWGYGWFWRLLLLGLAVYGALWGAALWLESPKLTAGLMFVAAAAGLVGPVAAGIWIGQRLVERGRRLHANALGWSLVVSGALIFGGFAGRNRDGYWESVDHGEIIGPAGTLAGLGMLLFGLGIALRHRRRGSADGH